MGQNVFRFLQPWEYDKVNFKLHTEKSENPSAEIERRIVLNKLVMTKVRKVT